ncbi:chromate transporter [Paenibacillus timonensis]|uniref:Chromate transporter n=1 Tax=Paenibacillus timonensis TaxID=225915 RepID=A0ABW3SBN6_9BACL|nr:chromate transporter [Paenibacillus timonensis]MCH1640767.1 chromate transporter [Paenibacillus timonensis]
MKPNFSKRMKQIGQIFVVFLKIGPSTFGGGYAMIATIEREIVHRKGWMSREEIGDMVSISGSAPGGVAVNSAAFIGYRLGGVIGAVAAVTAITMPTFLIVFLLSALSAMYKDNAKVAAALKGIHAAVVALIIVAAAKMWKSSVLDTATLVIMALAVAALLLTGIHSVYLILGGPIAGIAIVFVKKKCGMVVRTEKAQTEKARELQFPEYYI